MHRLASWITMIVFLANRDHLREISKCNGSEEVSMSFTRCMVKTSQ
jgi:hypothetical protein